MNKDIKKESFKNLSFTIPTSAHRTLKITAAMRSIDLIKYLRAILVDKANKLDSGEECKINLENDLKQRK